MNNTYGIVLTGGEKRAASQYNGPYWPLVSEQSSDTFALSQVPNLYTCLNFITVKDLRAQKQTTCGTFAEGPGYILGGAFLEIQMRSTYWHEFVIASSRSKFPHFYDDFESVTFAVSSIFSSRIFSVPFSWIFCCKCIYNHIPINDSV